MTSETKETETIRVVKFDGSNDDDWRVWEAKTRAIGTMKRWRYFLDNKPPSSIDF